MSASSVAAPTIIPLKNQQFASTEGKGKKGSIKTDTPIELSSDTANAAIYYTVNGDKPDPFSAPSRRRRNKATIRYTKPFTLPTGKLTIRAVAVKDNGVASSVVTREFMVEQAPIEKDVSASMHLQEVEESSDGGEEEEDGSTDGDSPEGQAEGTQHPPRGTQLTAALQSRGEPLSKGVRICLQCSHHFHGGPGIHNCPRCSYPMPSVPTPLSEPHPSQFSSCPRCHAGVPKSLSSCPSCNTSMEGVAKVTRIIAQYNQTIKGGVMCDYCGTVNTRDSHQCVTCERTITPLQHCPFGTKQVYPLMFFGAEELCVMCSACGRVNARDARFCDWCGVQPEKTIMDVVCCVCSTANSWQARSCTSCKLPMDPTIRPTHVDRSRKWKVTDRPDGCVWYPVVEAEDEEVTVEEEEPVPTVEQGTQTHGFYKSARSMDIIHSAAVKEQQHQHSTSQHPAPPSHAYSPGRGFWRQQVDHVAHHLRTYTANCEEFQQAFGQLQMGKLSSAVLSEVKSDEEATVTLTFQLRDKAKGSTQDGVTTPALLSLTNKKGNSFRMGNIAQLAMTTNKAKRAFAKPTHLTAESYLLIKELSVDGKGRADIVRQLVEEGGSVNTASEQGDPLICLAASGGHCEALKVLIDCGADLTKPSRNGDMALHAAVLGGNGNTSCVELLLKSGCNPKVLNRAGLTAGQLAQEKGYSKPSALLTAHVGSAMLRSLLK